MEEKKPIQLITDKKELPKEGHFMRNRGKYLLGLGAASSLASAGAGAVAGGLIVGHAITS